MRLAADEQARRTESQAGRVSAQEIPEDFTDFLRALNARGIEYLIVGGYAVGLHRYVRDTGDIDVFIRATDISAEKALEALTAISRECLIRNKQAAGRPKVIRDVEVLESSEDGDFIP